MASRRPVRVLYRVPPCGGPVPCGRRARLGDERGAWARVSAHARSVSRGQALVELALVTPILLILLLAAIDLGRLFYAEIAVQNSAREGAMVAANQPTGFVAGSACDVATNPVMCAATSEGKGGMVTIGTADVAMSCSPSCSQTYGTHVTVTVTGHFQVITPLLWAFTGGSNVMFSKSATADVIVTPAAAGYATPSPSSSQSASPSASASASPSASASASASASPTPTPTPTCPPPTVLFTYSQQNKNKPVEFTSNSTPATGACAISYWRWDFGDTTTSAGAIQTASHQYASEGTNYSVTLTVTTPSGTFSYIGVVHTKP